MVLSDRIELWCACSKRRSTQASYGAEPSGTPVTQLHQADSSMSSAAAELPTAAEMPADGLSVRDGGERERP
jgi:hypothetical protein